jgi:Tol biopolymer transport system component
VRFAIPSPGRIGDDAVSVSPDGRHVAFAAAGSEGKPILWVRSLDDTQLRSIPGTEEVTSHFWSPDAVWIGFFAQGKLKKVNTTTRAVETLGNATNPRGGTWGADNTIVLSPSAGQGLFAVSASGGDFRPLTTLDPGRAERSHRWPMFLPDGRHFLFSNRSGNPEHTGVYVGSIDSAASTRVAAGASNAAYVAPGYLLFVRGETFYAQPFDLGTLRTTGEAEAVREPVRVEPGAALADFSVSTNGVLAYRSGEGMVARLIWVDRRGNQLATLSPGLRNTNLALSPDDGRIAATRFGEMAAGDVWLIDSSSGTESRLTFESSGESQPIWSPDGQWIAFGSDRSGFLDLYRKRANGGEEELLLSSPVVKYACSWSVDNRHLVFEADDPATKLDLWMLPLSGDRTPVPLLKTRADEWDGRLSPDGKWMAYTSNESGRYEVYVQSFPPGGAKWQVSPNGGLHPRWRADGKELFYVAGNQKLTAVMVDLTTQFSVTRRQELFELSIRNLFTVRSPFVVSSDGQRFLFEDVKSDVVPPVHLVLNWANGLRR